MPDVAASEHHEAIWEALPVGLESEAFAARRTFLLAGVSPGERVLDLGCGEGRFAAELSRAGADVTAADVAEEPLRRARAAVPGLDARLLPLQGAWPLDDVAFDVVWAGEVIEHVADTAAWLSEVRRVLRPGGNLLLSTPGHPFALRARLAVSGRAFARHFDPVGDHLRFYTRASLTDALETFGFERVAVGVARPRAFSAPLLLASAERSRF